MKNINPVIGIIGGSGIYDLDGLKNSKWVKVETPFGKTSDDLLVGEFLDCPVIFLPRHGRGHSILPSEINYKANIDALKRLGATDIISLSAVGSLREDISPGFFVIVDQFIDRTFLRSKTFFSSGLAAHVSIADPTCGRNSKVIQDSGKRINLDIINEGTYIVIEGPQFSSRAESELYRSWGCSVIGMTNMPEAKLAREAEMCYSTIAMVTDYDCWHSEHKNVDVKSVIKNLNDNSEKAKLLLSEIIPNIYVSSSKGLCPEGCQNSLDNAVMTSPEKRDPAIMRKLDAIAGRVL